MRIGLIFNLVLLTFVLPFNLPIEAQDKRVAQAEQLYAQRSDLSQVRHAISLLAELAEADPQDYEVQWRLAKYYHFLGKHAAKEQEKLDALQRGMAAGKRATLLQPDRPEGYFWLAANYGTYGQQKGMFTQLKLVKPMRQALEKAIRLDPDYENGSPYAVLGKLDSEVPRLFGGNFKRGIESLEKAVKIGPDNSLAKLFLAESYLKAGRKQEAKPLLEAILTMAPDKNYEFEFTENQAEARRLLTKHFK